MKLNKAKHFPKFSLLLVFKSMHYSYLKYISNSYTSIEGQKSQKVEKATA